MTLEELSGGRHELSLKATRFGPILFTEAVEVPRDGEVTITVNLAERTLMVELGRPQVKPAEASTAPASEALTAAVAAELPVASAPETGAAADVSDQFGTARVGANGGAGARNTPPPGQGGPCDRRETCRSCLPSRRPHMAVVAEIVRACRQQRVSMTPLSRIAA